MNSNEIIIERALLIGVRMPKQEKWDSQESLQELKSLALTAGVEIGDIIEAPVRQISAGTFLGKGKIEEVHSEILEHCYDLVIFDGELSASQARNLEEVWKIRVLDRTGLILDIFALHAKSKEGKLQVELAQYEYLYPRLVRAWTHLSKQRGGGVGLRGPGETQLEVDRRRIREKMERIKKALLKVETSRDLHRKRRESGPIPTVSLIGYTNSGKSTLFNSLTGASEIAQDKLFATLDPKTSKLKLPSGRLVLLTDTVGFIRNLPHQLIESFKSTFKEARESNLLLHIIDGSSPIANQQIEIVDKVINDLKLDEVPQIKVLNKKDKENFHADVNGLNPLCISAKYKDNLDILLKAIDNQLSAVLKSLTLFLPNPYGALLASLYSHGRVFHTEVTDRGIIVEVSLPEKWKGKFEGFKNS